MLWPKKGPGNDRNPVTIKLFALLPLASLITGQDAKVMICNQPSPWIISGFGSTHGYVGVSGNG